MDFFLHSIMLDPIFICSLLEQYFFVLLFYFLRLSDCLPSHPRHWQNNNIPSSYLQIFLFPNTLAWSPSSLNPRPPSWVPASSCSNLDPLLSRSTFILGLTLTLSLGSDPLFSVACIFLFLNSFEGTTSSNIFLRKVQKKVICAYLVVNLISHFSHLLTGCRNLK